MSVYSIAVFLHIVGAMGLFGALSLEWAGLVGLRRAASAAQVRESAKLLGATRFVGAPAAITLLVTGIYMSMSAPWGRQAWIGLGLVGLVVIAVLGGVLTGRRTRAIARLLPPEGGPISAELGSRLHDPVLMLSVWLRTALALGIVFLMSTKPSDSGALTALGVAVLLGVVAAISAWGGGRPAAAHGLRRPEI